MRRAVAPLSRYIATPDVSKNRAFRFLHSGALPDATLRVIARDDDFTFGLLESAWHKAWALAAGSSLEDRPRYNNTRCFETFPWPEGLTPDIPVDQLMQDPRAQAVAAAAEKLDEYRERWLNPPEWTVRLPIEVGNYPDRILPKNEECAKRLKKRTLTNLYNENPEWLRQLHAGLDTAVACAYGWPSEIPVEDALRRLFEINRSRA